MPKLLAFLACEKIIIEKTRETPTAVSIMQNVEVGILPGATSTAIPPNALIPQHWAIFSAWDHETEDVGKTFHQKAEIIMPDQSVSEYPKVDLPFLVENHLSFNSINIIAFPIGQQGILRIKMWLESPDGKSVSPEYYYPINVKYMPAPQDNSNRLTVG